MYDSKQKKGPSVPQTSNGEQNDSAVKRGAAD